VAAAICRRVIGISVDGVRANLGARGRESQIDDANIRDFRVVQTDRLSFEFSSRGQAHEVLPSKPPAENQDVFTAITLTLASGAA
jgi:hypothetical protein